MKLSGLLSWGKAIAENPKTRPVVTVPSWAATAATICFTALPLPCFEESAEGPLNGRTVFSGPAETGATTRALEGASTSEAFSGSKAGALGAVLKLKRQLESPTTGGNAEEG